MRPTLKRDWDSSFSDEQLRVTASPHASPQRMQQPMQQSAPATSSQSRAPKSRRRSAHELGDPGDSEENLEGSSPFDSNASWDDEEHQRSSAHPTHIGQPAPMQIMQVQEPELPEIRAVVLVQTSDSATDARVVLPYHAFDRFVHNGRRKNIQEADHLGIAATAIVARELRVSPDDFSLTTSVYTVLPGVCTTEPAPPVERLRKNMIVELDRSHVPLLGNERLRLADGSPIVKPYVVLLTQLPPMSPAPGPALLTVVQDPVQWLRSKYPDSEPRDSTLKPTAVFPRQGRYEQVRDLWQYMCQHQADLRKPLPYVYGTSGSGKTTILKYIAERSDEDMGNLVVKLRGRRTDKTYANWARNAVVMSVSFNSETSITPFDKELLERELYLAPAIVRLLFFQQSEETDFKQFSKQLRKACGEDTSGTLRDKLDDLDHLLESLQLWTPTSAHRARRPPSPVEKFDVEEQRRALVKNPPPRKRYFESDDKYVVLLVDELAKIPAAYVEEVRKQLCAAMDDRPLYVVFSSLSVELMDKEVTGSNRGIFRFGLPLLETAQAEEMIETAFRESDTTFKLDQAEDESEALSQETRERAAHMLALLSGGHPRTVEWLVRKATGRVWGASIDSIVEAVRNAIVQSYKSALDDFPWHLFMRVFIGTKVRLKETIPDARGMKYDDAVKMGFLIGGSSDNAIRPMISEIQVRALCDNFGSVDASSEMRPILAAVRGMLNATPNFHGKLFESFHMNWEIVRRNCILLSDVPKDWGLLAYYNCGAPGNSLGLGFGKGPLCDPANQPTLLLNQGLLGQKHFQAFGKATLRYNGRTSVPEFPPSYDDCLQNSGYLNYVWKGSYDTYPAIDFVIVVLLRILLATAIEPVEQPVALVFQSKFSGDDAKTTLGAPAVQDYYDGAKKIMNHAGWQDDQFIYVVHAYRDLTDDLRRELPANCKNILVLTKESMHEMYGSMGDTLALLSLRARLTSGESSSLSDKPAAAVPSTPHPSEDDRTAAAAKPAAIETKKSARRRGTSEKK